MKMAKGKPLVVAGCVPQGAPRSTYLSNISTIGVQQIDRVVEVVEETLKGIIKLRFCADLSKLFH